MLNLYNCLLTTVSQPEAFQQSIDTALMSVVQSAMNQSVNIQSSNNFFTFMLRQSEKELNSKVYEKVALYTKYVSLLTNDVGTKTGELQNLSIVCSMRLSQLIDEMKQKMQNIPIKTVYHKQFVEQLKQTDITMVNKLKKA